jgi:glycosyltransferase involved in cell wall biosynthesis
MSSVFPHTKKALTILYDYQGFTMEFGGVSRYYTELIRHLPDTVKWMIAIRRTRNLYLQAPPFCIPPMRKEYTGNDFVRDVLHGHRIRGVHRLFHLLRCHFPELVRADAIANEIQAKRLARRRSIDLIHLTEPHFFRDDWKNHVGKKPFVITVVDLIPDILHSPRLRRSLRQEVLAAAAGIISISQYTKDCVVDEYKIPESKIRVIHLGPDPIGTVESESPLPRLQYILYVGRRQEQFDYKNFPFFIRAVAPLLRSRTNLYLLCTGKPFEEYDNAIFREYGISDKVVHQFADDSQMTNLFAHAEVFVYPSKMEGFGIPILDAFAAGCPVALARSTCFPEIAGDAAVYFRFDDEAEILRAVTNVLDNPSVRSNLIAKGKRRLQEFSWQKCARETEAFYREVLSGTASP